MKRLPRRAMPWAALTLVTAMAAGGAVFGIVEAPSGTPYTSSRQPPPSHPPPNPVSVATPASVTPPGPPDPPSPGPLSVNGSAWAGHGDLAFVSRGQLEVLSNTGSLTTITGPTDGGFDSNPAWSTDSQWLAFLYTGPANGFDVPAPSLWLVKAGSSQAEEVANTAVGMFAWSPVASVLAYTVAPGNDPVFGPEDVWIEDPRSPPKACLSVWETPWALSHGRPTGANWLSTTSPPRNPRRKPLLRPNRRQGSALSWRAVAHP